MIAVIKTGGKQYLVSPGDKIEVESLDVEEGKEFTFDEVLLFCHAEDLSKADATDIKIGTPTVTGAKVTAKVLAHTKGEKLIIFKYKPKKRYKRKIGHRQTFTEVQIVKIEG